MPFYLYHDTIGLIHLIAAVIALLTGTLVLALPKGTARHRQVGYVYAAAMVVVVATAFMIYRLFGGFGVFHVAAVVSGLTLAGGMIPVLLRRPAQWATLHFSFMYWSVMGLYAAFVSEIATRVPPARSAGLLVVSLGTALVMGLGGAWFYRRKEQWQRQFGEETEMD